MNSRLINWFQFQQGGFSRLLSLLLLVFIIYGTTVEAAHRHGRILSPDTAPAASSNSSSAEGAGNFAGCSDCLLCQLHLNFSTALTNARISTNPPLLSSLFSIIESAVLHIDANAPQSGRAPPASSLV